MKVINKNSNRVTIEHNNFRSVVTPELYKEFEDGILTAEELIESGIPVSIQWSDFITVNITAKDIELELHKQGIHTLDDLLKNTQKVSGAILTTMGLSAGIIYKHVERAKEDQKI